VTAYDVIAIDWSKPNVIATFHDRGAADRYAEAMDSSGLRCIVVSPESEPRFDGPLIHVSEQRRLEEGLPPSPFPDREKNAEFFAERDG
jgi:hypothetical protein